MKSTWISARSLRMGVLFALGLLLASAGSAFAGATVKVDLWSKNDGSQGITVSPSEIKAGKVTFDVTNTSTNLQHELLFDKTDLAPDQLPMKDAGAEVDESKLKHFHEFGDLEPGQSKTWTAELAPGRYILFCNEVGHFAAGMHTILSVTS